MQSNSGVERTVKQSVAFQNSPNVTFAGWLAYLGAIALWSLSILLLCLGHPGWITIDGLFLASLSLAVLCQRYLTHSYGSLSIGPQGMEYFSITGEKASFRWQELTQVKVLPGWLRIYDKQGKKIFSYTYSLGRQHALINVITKQIGNRKKRPVIWPDIVSVPTAALKKAIGKSKKGAGTLHPQGAQKKKNIATTKAVRTKRPRLTTSTSGNKSRNRKRRLTNTNPRADHESLRRQS